MSWYTTVGASPNYVLFSKVRYIRNEAKRNFYHLLDSKRAQESLAKINALLTSNGFRGESVAQGLSPAMLSLCEKHFIERDFAYSDRQRALYLNEPCNLLVAVGGRDLISISSLTSGLSVIEAENMASKAEELIDREITFAYNDRLGYLSPAPEHTGSGITFSAALYLPSLRLSESSVALQQCIRERGMSLEAMFNKSKCSADLYVLSYTPYYLADEDSAAVFFSDAISAIVDSEKTQMGITLQGRERIIYEGARRALGILLYAESMSECEMLERLSEIRLALCLGNENGQKELLSAQDINYLCAEGLNSSVVACAKEGCNSMEQCNVLRASLIKRYINHKNEVS